MKAPEGSHRFIDQHDLQALRKRTDWRQLFDALGLERAPKSREDDWWALSPFTDEKTPSFHINDHGWYCHSTGQGGGVIELVQKVIEHRTGQAMNCYAAGHWLIDNGLSGWDEAENGRAVSNRPIAVNSSEGREEREGRPGENRKTESREPENDTAADKVNRPIRQTLLPLLDREHPEFERRGISKETADYLGCGYLGASSKSPLAGRMVFQVRGVQEAAGGGLEPVILTHMGRALTPEQEREGGKWRPYAGFSKTRELYNIDQALLDARAIEQARDTGHLLVVEGCWDVAKLIEAGIVNVVATFGAHLSELQREHLTRIAERIGIERFRFWYDRDKAGREGQAKALQELLDEPLLSADAFDWNIKFVSKQRGLLTIPPEIGDVCEFSVEQLRWLRGYQLI